MRANPIDAELERQLGQSAETPSGAVGRIAEKYRIESDHLLGLLLKLDFAESHLVTCDAWKRKCAGVPRGSFVLFRIDPRAVNSEDRHVCNRLILARITDAVPTPVETNVQQTLFQVHKLQAQLDPLTHEDLQWGALKASIVGTYYDDSDEIGFGNDVDTFFSPFAYVAYRPTDEDLTVLVNSFVRPDRRVQIGWLRYTETPPPSSTLNVPIYIDPDDIVGEPTSAQRLANFGKTRYGKSNANKIIAQAIFESGLDVAQIFFDPSGEYTYINDQDGTSLYALYHQRSVRYALTPRPLRADERERDLDAPRLLRINFYEFPAVGHSLVVSLWNTENSNIPGYITPMFDWAPLDNPPDRTMDISGFHHYWRTMGMWFAVLHRAGFAAPEGLAAPITFQREVKRALMGVTGIATDNRGNFRETGQLITALPAIYREVARLYRDHKGQQGWFEPSTDGSDYFSDLEEKLLRMLSDDTLRAHNYLRPFNKYHSPQGSSIFEDIANFIERGTSVFVDMSQSNEVVRNNLVERVCRVVFHRQNQRFNSEQGVGNCFVMFYFEEAHRLFNKDDSDLNSIYNLLAKEGAKLNIAMVYSTQSMTTISPDLIKNTDNFLIAHLDDDREAREVTRKYAFRDVAEDVQRIQSRGFVRMITRSHKFALPVQIRRFQAPARD
jgi:Helicase HerA, central domain